MSFPHIDPAAAEEFEMTSADVGVPQSRPRHRRTSSHSRKTFTLQRGASTAFFGGPSSPLAVLRGNPLDGDVVPKSPGRSHSFLIHDDPLGGTETVEVPDFGGLLGLSGEPDDNNEISRSMKSAWKRRLFLLMEEPSSSSEAFCVHVAVTVAILASALLTTLSTLPSFHTNPGSTRALFGLDTMIVVLFTIEYLARLVAHSDSWRMCWKWATTFFALVDLLAILPYYIEVALQKDTTILFRFSILRTFRLLRVFRAFKYQNQMLFTIEAMYVATHKSKDALLALSFFIGMALVVFSTLIYFAERGTWDANLGTFVSADGDPSQFDSIPSAAWFVLVTITTVGYGEIIPRSILGRLLTVPLLVFGLLLIALPSFVLGRNFAIVFDAMQNQAMNKIHSVGPTPRQSVDAMPSISSQSIRTTSPNALAGPSRMRSRSPPPLVFRPGQTSPKGAYDSLPGLERDVGGGGGGGGGVQGPSSAREGKQELKDLTNTKLARNQQVLLTQIESLKAVVDRQDLMLTRIMSALEGNKTELRNRGNGLELNGVEMKDPSES